MPQEEEKHAGIESRIDDLYPKDGIGGSVVDSTRIVERANPVVVIHPVAVTVSAAILSSGAVAALIYFMHLCFVYPNAANVVIPLLMTPLITHGVKSIKERKDRKQCDK